MLGSVLSQNDACKSCDNFIYIYTDIVNTTCRIPTDNNNNNHHLKNNNKNR